MIIEQIVKTVKKVSIPERVHRIFVIDCSGSMYKDIDNIRSQMKNKIPQLTNINDTISIIWFSSKNEAGILQEGLEVKSVKDFTGLNNAIDKYLRAMNLTGFKDPLDLVETVVTNLKAKYKSGVYHMFFMTDGCDNQWNETEILKSVKNLSKYLNSATFVEYGWYCNRALMTKMADTLGASLILDESFEQYSNEFELNLTKNIFSSNKVEVKLTNTTTLGFVSYIDGNDICSSIVEENKVFIPEHVKNVSYYTTEKCKDTPSEDSLYLMLYSLASRMLGNEALDTLKMLGDVYLVEEFTNCFSKQDYVEFQDKIKQAIFDVSKRYLKGKDFKCVPADNAFTVLDLLNELTSDEENLFYPYDEKFNYDRISIKSEQKANTINDDDIAALTEKLKSLKTKDELKTIQDEISKIIATSKEKLEFKPITENPGVNVIDLVWNSSRPNVSIKVVINGTVELPKNDFKIPTTFETKIFRTYTFIKDGIKHSSCKCMPFSLSKKSFLMLQKNGLLKKEKYAKDKIYYINANLPVINRSMTKQVLASEFFKLAVDLQKLKSSQKVFNTFFNNEFTKASNLYVAIYGEEGVNWLKELGITESSGFNPESKRVESTDTYISKELDVSIAKCSSIPTINSALIEKVEKNPAKLTLSERLCFDSIDRINKFKLSDVYTASKNKENLYKTWLTDERNTIIKEVRELNKNIAKMIFTIMVGHIWFKEFASLDENSMVIDKDFNCKAELKDSVVKI